MQSYIKLDCATFESILHSILQFCLPLRIGTVICNWLNVEICMSNITNIFHIAKLILSSITI